MIKISVLYPRTESSRFDMDYYLNRHFPMLQARLGDALKAVAAERGVGGAMPGSAPAFMAMGHLWFESVAAYEAAFGPHAAEIVADVSNYSNVNPVIQVSEVLLG